MEPTRLRNLAERMMTLAHEILNELNESEKEKPRGELQMFFEYWAEQFKEKRGEPYTFSYAQEGKLMKPLIQSFGLETVKSRIPVYLELNDEFLNKSGHRISTFIKRFNGLKKQEKGWIEKYVID